MIDKKNRVNDGETWLMHTTKIIRVTYYVFSHESISPKRKKTRIIIKWHFISWLIVFIDVAGALNNRRNSAFFGGSLEGSLLENKQEILVLCVPLLFSRAAQPAHFRSTYEHLTQEATRYDTCMCMHSKVA